LFFYLACSYIIFGTQIREFGDAYAPLRLLRILGRLSVFVQAIYLVYGYGFIPGFSILEATDYSYFSPLVIMGIITYAADVITRQSSIFIKALKFVFAMVLAFSTGHSSAFLGIFIVLLVYAYIKIKPYQRYVSFLFILMAVLSLFLLPQFTDFNASWRIYFWKHILNRSVSDGYLLLGHGFGKPYMTYDYALVMYKALNSSIVVERYYPEVKYVVPPHNSILTIVFHIGMIPALLFFFPMIKMFQQIFVKKFPEDNNVMFLILALIGSIVWICFNVILELPHSASFFWLVYFTSLYYVKMHK
jgi:hypothetical protein